MLHINKNSVNKTAFRLNKSYRLDLCAGPLLSPSPGGEGWDEGIRENVQVSDALTLALSPRRGDSKNQKRLSVASASISSNVSVSSQLRQGSVID